MQALKLGASRSQFCVRRLHRYRRFSSFSRDGAPDDLIARHSTQSDQEILEEAVAKVEPLAMIIDGKAMAHVIKGEVEKAVMKMRNENGEVPGLAILLIGEDRDSAAYVRNKKRDCDDVGMAFFQKNLRQDADEEEVLEQVEAFNKDPSVHGIVVQLPLPKHMKEERILKAVRIEKDVDGFHPLNVGKLAMQGRKPSYVPCASQVCVEMLLRSGVHICGKNIVVIGRSHAESLFIAMLLQRHHATVTLVHDQTQNPAAITRTADIVIAAVGIPHLVRGDWIKRGAFVIDVGIHYIHDPNSRKGYRVVGDVCYDEVSRIASAITPVPGGVGPMLIAMLLSNTLESAKRTLGFIK